MTNQSVLYGIIGLLLGVVITGYVASNAVNSNNTGMMRMMGMHSSETQNLPKNSHMMGNGEMMKNDMMESDDSMSMSGMVDALKGKTGDEFDKTFVRLMIEHHQGAIDMAKEAQVNAKHDEIKKLADDIISAQTSEINQMKQWQISWGYSK